MPVRLLHELRRMVEKEFAEIAYEVMGCVFQTHREFGRFFDERIYKLELARCLPDVELEFPIDVSFDPFHKRYFLDVVVRGGAVFEFKAVEALADRHRAQLLNYLLLCDLGHGKLVNIRPQTVEHEFVNSTLRLVDRTKFDIDSTVWMEFGNADLLAWLTGLLRDIGTGLDLELYEDAVTQLFGGGEQVKQWVDVVSGSEILTAQCFRLLQPGVAFKITTLSDGLVEFETHARRLLAHTRLEAIQWINIHRQGVTFRTLHKSHR